MNNHNIEEITKWVNAYHLGYDRYMRKNHFDLYNKFYNNILPPQDIGGCVMISKGKIHSAEDYAEIMKISKYFCEKYNNPQDFPTDF